MGYCHEKSKGKDGQDQTLLESREGEAIKGRQGGVPGSPVARVDVGVCTLGEGPFEKQTW